MIVLEPTAFSCAQNFDAVVQDRSCMALFVVLGSADLATRADSLTTGRAWRRVVLDRGCPSLAPRWVAILRGHAGAVGIMLDYGSGANDARMPVGFFNAAADVLQIESAFETATQQR
jgi:hypothetical protein